MTPARRALPLAVTIVALPWAAHAQGLDENVRALTRSIQLDHALVELGHIAGKKSQDPRIRQLAARVAQQAEQANAELRTLTRRHGLAFPDGMAPDDESRVAEVDEKKGRALDQAFLDEADSLQREARALAAELQQSAPERDVRAWARGAQRSLAATALRSAR